jgi:RNase P subunit RPR2
METKTCPHCAHLALRFEDADYDMTHDWMLAWTCKNCNSIFFTWKEDESEED